MKSSITNLSQPIGYGRDALIALIPAFQSLFADSVDSIVVSNLDGVIVYVNPDLLNKLHLDSFEAVSPDVLLSFFPDYVRMRDSTISSRSAKHVLIKTKDPSAHNMAHFFLLRDENSQIIGVLAIGYKIEISDADSLIQEQRRESYLRTLLDTFPFMVWMKDKDSRFLVTNKFFADAKSLGIHGLEGKTDYDYCPEFAEGYIRDDLEVMREGKSKTVIEHVVHGQEIRWAETHKSPVMVDGEAIGTVGFARDITDQLRMQEEMASQDAVYKALLANLPMTLIRYDKNCRRIFISPYNQGGYKFANALQFGKTPKEDWSQDITNLTGREYEDLIRNCIATKQQLTSEIVFEQYGVRYVNQVKFVPELAENNQVQSVLAIINDISELAEYRSKVEKLAFQDNLTGILSRTAFVTHAQRALEQAEQENLSLAIMLLDLDQFKSVNDTMGHAVGDMLLQEVTKRISNCISGDAIFGRLGGDEFVILIRGYKDMLALMGLASKILFAIKQPLMIDGGEYIVSASIGIARYRTDSLQLDELLKFADTAMYAAKDYGRNNYQFYTVDLTTGLERALYIKSALHTALKKGAMHLVYQPVVDLMTTEILGVEALCRWHDETLGEVSPTEFIAIAEETGAIVDIGYWIMENVFNLASEINAARQSPFKVSINISPRQFSDPAFVTKTISLMEASNCQPEWIKFEITESLLLEDDPKTLSILESFSHMGIIISIDDFGTGYSGLSYLNKFPINEIKIDRAFVNTITINDKDALLTKAIVAMAKSLGKELVAEGIETELQVKMLQSIGCSRGQGYLFAKPMTNLDLKTFLN